MAEKSPAAEHGTLVVIQKQGFLLTGKSGIGKTTLALQLLDRGHQLVADDLVHITADATGIIGSCPAAGRGYIHHKQLGLLPLTPHFGASAIIAEHPIDYIVTLTDAQLPTHNLEPQCDQRTCHGHSIPHYTLAHQPASVLPILLELLANSPHSP